jgi:hypothetical protein
MRSSPLYVVNFTVNINKTFKFLLTYFCFLLKNISHRTIYF